MPPLNVMRILMIVRLTLSGIKEVLYMKFNGMFKYFIFFLFVFFMSSLSYANNVASTGFSTIQDCLNNHILNPWLLLLLVLAKLLATCITVGSGASGGIFSPSLFMGATLGSAFGIVMNYVFPTFGVDPVLFTLIGMAAMLGSTTGALITSIILISEMMRSYHFTLPIIVTVLIAYMVRHYLCRENIHIKAA
jgi:chloride channel protein, CIC family